MSKTATKASKRRRKRLGREKLQQIIEMCRSVEERGLDPFLVDVDDVIAVIREYFPEWEDLDDLCLDAETINRLASVIKLQSEWVKHRSTSLYTDPFLLEEKIKSLEKEALVELFLQAWHPVVELEQISLHSLKNALNYWQNLAPLEERWRETVLEEVETGVASREELVEERILADETFAEELKRFWEELKAKTREKEKISYWDFVGADSYEETVHRAYMTSFLVTYGYATFEIYPLEEEVFIKPNPKPVLKQRSQQLVSIPISISFEEWKKWKEGTHK
ncbi:hypothetical protein DRO50_01350 [Candidatus Bathyarchaeota archaeon]|nr:MAG: hypothetical protein DRO50_01350 [Candidatus Bathyarchaeota archaeon]